MPNHVLNRVSLKGSEADILALKKFMKCDKKEFSFNSIVPMPSILEGSVSEVLGKIGYKVLYGNFEEVLNLSRIPDTIKTRSSLLEFLENDNPEMLKAGSERIN